METQQKEFESFFFIKLTKNVFMSILNKHFAYEKHIIIYFRNNIRVSDQQIQIKTHLQQSRILKITKNAQFIPLIRRISLEESYTDRLDFSSMTTIIIRYTIYQKDNIRIALEKQILQNGCGQYVLTGEVEYKSQNEFSNYNILQSFEAQLLYRLQLISNDRINHYLNFDEISIRQLLDIRSRVFHKFHKSTISIRNHKDLKIIKKYDGHKCIAFQQQNDQLILFHMMKVETRSIKLFDERVIFQFEIMHDSCVLVDIIGVYINNKLFMPEPLELFQYFNKWILKQEKINNGPPQLFNKPIIIQHPTKILPHLSYNECDGFIIIHENKLYKMKTPTIDVELNEDGYLTVDNHVLCHKSDVVSGLSAPGIYEITKIFHPPHEIVILRYRYDRIYSSTFEEYQEFLEEWEYIKAREHLF